MLTTHTRLPACLFAYSRVNVVFDSEGHLALPPDSLLYRPGTSDFDDMAAWVAELVNSTTSQVKRLVQGSRRIE